MCPVNNKWNTYIYYIIISTLLSLYFIYALIKSYWVSHTHCTDSSANLTKMSFWSWLFANKNRWFVATARARARVSVSAFNVRKLLCQCRFFEEFRFCQLICLVIYVFLLLLLTIIICIFILSLMCVNRNISKRIAPTISKSTSATLWCDQLTTTAT